MLSGVTVGVGVLVTVLVELGVRVTVRVRVGVGVCVEQAAMVGCAQLPIPSHWSLVHSNPSSKQAVPLVDGRHCSVVSSHRSLQLFP